MAKQSIVATIRAKPNERGRTSHIPFPCSLKGCDEDYFAITGTFSNRKKVCKEHYYNPPVSDANAATIALMAQFGIVVR
jgi:hypothetical protein